MELYEGYVLVRDLISAYGKPLPAGAKQAINESDVRFGNMKCVKVSNLYGDVRRASESCLKLDCLYPPAALSIELGFCSEYLGKQIIGCNKKIQYEELSLRQKAVVLTDRFLALLKSGFLPYRADRGVYYSHKIDFYGVEVGFCHPDLIADIDDSSCLPKPYSIETHSTGIRGVVIYHSNRRVGRSVGFQALWTEKGKEKLKSFSIQKYGFNEAYKLALNERCKRIGAGEITHNCRLDFSVIEARLKRMGLAEFIGMKPATADESRRRRSLGIRVNNNTGIDGVILTTKKEKGVVYLTFRSRCLINGKEHSMSCSVKSMGFLSAAKEVVLWRMRRTGRAEFFSESLLCKKRIAKWIMRSDEVRDAALKLNDEWLSNVLAENSPDFIYT